LIRAHSSATGRSLKTEFGYVAGNAPRDTAFRVALADEVDRLRSFLDLRSE